jgi:hypothetical protein
MHAVQLPVMALLLKSHGFKGEGLTWRRPTCGTSSLHQCTFMSEGFTW